jgi:hypothetical protein
VQAIVDSNPDPSSSVQQQQLAALQHDGLEDMGNEDTADLNADYQSDAAAAAAAAGGGGSVEELAALAALQQHAAAALAAAGGQAGLIDSQLLAASMAAQLQGFQQAGQALEIQGLAGVPDAGQVHSGLDASQQLALAAAAAAAEQAVRGG